MAASPPRRQSATSEKTKTGARNTQVLRAPVFVFSDVKENKNAPLTSSAGPTIKDRGQSRKRKLLPRPQDFIKPGQKIQRGRVRERAPTQLQEQPLSKRSPVFRFDLNLPVFFYPLAKGRHHISIKVAGPGAETRPASSWSHHEQIASQKCGKVRVRNGADSHMVAQIRDSNNSLNAGMGLVIEGANDLSQPRAARSPLDEKLDPKLHAGGKRRL